VAVVWQSKFVPDLVDLGDCLGFPSGNPGRYQDKCVILCHNRVSSSKIVRSKVQTLSEECVPGLGPHTRVVQHLRGKMLGEIRVEATQLRFAAFRGKVVSTLRFSGSKKRMSSAIRVEVHSVRIPTLDSRMPR
jgi:hypothetical protein